MSRLITKKSTVPGKVPLPADLEIGELAVNTADAKLYTKHSSGDVVELGGAGGYRFLNVATNTTAEPNDFLLVNTSSAVVTITLPASPVAGDVAIIADAASSFGLNAVIIDRNGSTIQTLANNLTLSNNSKQILFEYDGSTWQVFVQDFDMYQNPGLLTLSGPSAALELETITVLINDYNPAATYTYSVTGGSAIRSLENISWTLPSVLTDTTYVLTVTRVVSGVTHNRNFAILVSNIATVADGFIFTADFSVNQYNYGWAY